MRFLGSAIAAILLSMGLPCGFAMAASSGDPTAEPANWEIFRGLEGEWHSDGTAFGRPAKLTMSWEPALDQEFFHIRYRIEPKGAASRIFEGVGFYRPLGNGQHEGTWFDSGGEMHHIAASDDGMALTSFWGVPGEKYGRTVYRMLESGALEVVDAIETKDGAWKEFSRNLFERAQTN